jgi:hypothetical protein
LNGVNPIVDVSLDPSGSLRFTNAAVAAGVAAHVTYTIAWARFDNESAGRACLRRDGPVWKSVGLVRTVAYGRQKWTSPSHWSGVDYLSIAR